MQIVPLNEDSPTTSTHDTSESEVDNPTSEDIQVPSLISPYMVANKYKQLKTLSRISTLAVRLAKESYFGKWESVQWREKGTREHAALPAKTLDDLKRFLQNLFPNCTQPEFEVAWKSCLEALGQSCNSLRKKTSFHKETP